MTSYHIKLTDEFSFGNIYNQNIFPFLFAEFAKQQLGIKPSENYLRTLEKTIDHYPYTFDDFQYKILLNYFLFKYYQDHNPEKAKEHFQLALELSDFARYDFYTAFLLNHNPINDKKLKKQKKRSFFSNTYPKK